MTTRVGASNGIVRDDESALVTIQVGESSGACVLCVPGAGATPVDFLALASALGPRARVYGLQPRALTDPAAHPHVTVEAAARDYVHALRMNAAPPTHIHLVGHSFGGWVAFEMALRLTDAGFLARSLTLLDTAHPGAAGSANSEDARMEALMELMSLYEGTLGPEPAELATLDESAQLTLVHRLIVKIGALPPQSSPEDLVGPLRLLEAAVRTTYEPSRSFTGPVNLVLIADVETRLTPARRFDAAVEWRRYAPALQVSSLAASHLTILRPPHVTSWAQWISDQLRGDAASPPSGQPRNE